MTFLPNIISHPSIPLNLNCGKQCLTMPFSCYTFTVNHGFLGLIVLYIYIYINKLILLIVNTLSYLEEVKRGRIFNGTILNQVLISEVFKALD